MKNLRVLFAALLVVFAFASCEKSDIKPRCSGDSSSTEQSTSGNQNVSGRVKSTSPASGAVITTNDNPNPLDIVGGGDDDRDGGDKKKSTVGK